MALPDAVDRLQFNEAVQTLAGSMISARIAVTWRSRHLACALGRFVATCPDEFIRPRAVVAANAAYVRLRLRRSTSNFESRRPLKAVNEKPHGQLTGLRC